MWATTTTTACLKRHSTPQRKLYRTQMSSKRGSQDVTPVRSSPIQFYHPYSFESIISFTLLSSLRRRQRLRRKIQPGQPRTHPSPRDDPPCFLANTGIRFHAPLLVTTGLDPKPLKTHRPPVFYTPPASPILTWLLQAPTERIFENATCSASCGDARVQSCRTEV
jgi:hypothetical protein